MILNPEIKPKLKEALEKKPNMLLYGPPGVGKGTFTHIFLEQAGCDYMWINASDKTGIDHIRNDVRVFAYAPDADVKVVVFNEADALSSGQSGAQKILRQLIEDTHKQTRFFFLANYDQYIIPEIKSRCYDKGIAIDRPPKREIGALCIKILRAEGIEYDGEDVKKIIEKCYPDIRNTILALQSNSIDGKLASTHTFSSEEIFQEVLDKMLEEDPDLVRKVLKSNYINYIQLYEYLYENCGKFKSPGDMILEIGEAMKWDPTVGNREINFMYMMIRLMKKDALV
jgi:DNA polymerase III delta prime subunit